MTKKAVNARRKLGMKPGSVVYIGREQVEKARIDIIDYTSTELTETRVETAEECLAYRDSPSVSWVNVDGIHDTALVEKIGGHFEAHPLLLEDIVNTGQRPKLDESTAFVFITLKMLYYSGSVERGGLRSEQVSLLFGERWVLTFQETGEDVFDTVRQRLKQTVPRVRFMHSDYLAYALIDAIIDHYFVVLEQIGEEIEALEDSLAEKVGSDSLATIRVLKRRLLRIRKAVWPLREVIGNLERSENPLIQGSTRPYLRDLYEHAVQVIDTVETYRDMVSGLLELYHTAVSNRMNEVMKVLTVFATIFIPLGFLAGVYGMNFDTTVSPFNLPELGFRYGYPFFWGLVLATAGSLLWFFRRKGWL
jgi:magnesium transporter